MVTLSGCVASFPMYTYTILILTNQTLFPTIDLEDVNGTFQRGLQLIKEAAVREMKAGDVEERVLDDVEEWSPPPCLLNAALLSQDLQKAALDTAYGRYVRWRSKLKTGLPYATQCITQSSQARPSCPVSTALN